MDRIEYAVQLERETELFYRKMADDFTEEGLRTVFTVLADEEKTHRELLTAMKNGTPVAFSNTHSEIKNVFDELGHHKEVIHSTKRLLDGFGRAMEKEEESIRMCQEFLSTQKPGIDREIIQLIAVQEGEHYKLIEELLKPFGTI